MMMSIDSIAVVILLSITEFLGVTKVSYNGQEWSVTKNWNEKNGTYEFEANSYLIVKECQKMPSNSIVFPSILHSVQLIELDNRLINQFGDPSFSTTRSFYGSPIIPCKDILNGRMLNWHVYSQTRYFSRILKFPQIEDYPNLHNLFSEVSNIASAGALLLFEILIILLFLGRIPHYLAICLSSSVFFLAMYFIFCVPGLFGLHVSMLFAHRVADFSIWMGLHLLCCALTFQKLLDRNLLKVIGFSVGVSAIIICIANTEDGIQLGTTIPMPFILPTLGLATFRSFKKFFSTHSSRRGLLESLSLALFVGTLFHDCFLVVGLIQGPALASFGLIFGLSFLLVALNEYVISVFQERDQLKLQKMKLLKDAEFASLARQISHDIRSPLAALSVVLKEFSGLSEDVRKISEIAVERIQYIANGLLAESKDLKQQKKNEEERQELCHNRSPVFLPSILEEIVTEKRVQFRFMSKLRIELDFNGPLESMFSTVQSNDLKRVLSNLINNSFEAMVGSGVIKVSLEAKNHAIICRVSDNGKGISEKILPKLMEEGSTFGKERGNGLGLSHAKKVVEAWGGSIQLESQLGTGTVVTLAFSRVGSPSWYASVIRVPSTGNIIILDDDASIHEVWKSRFRSIQDDQFETKIVNFYDENELKKWFFHRASKNDSCIYLFDYKLRNSSTTGLDLIQSLGIAEQAILVTSHFEEESVQKQCQDLGVKMIPKSMASQVSISIT